MIFHSRFEKEEETRQLGPRLTQASQTTHSTMSGWTRAEGMATIRRDQTPCPFHHRPIVIIEQLELFLNRQRVALSKIGLCKGDLSGMDVDLDLDLVVLRVSKNDDAMAILMAGDGRWAM